MWWLTNIILWYHLFVEEMKELLPKTHIWRKPDGSNNWEKWK